MFYIVDFVIARTERYYPNKLMGSGFKPKPAGGHEEKLKKKRLLQGNPSCSIVTVRSWMFHFIYEGFVEVLI